MLVFLTYLIQHNVGPAIYEAPWELIVAFLNQLNKSTTEKEISQEGLLEDYALASMAWSSIYLGGILEAHRVTKQYKGNREERILSVGRLIAQVYGIATLPRTLC
jgi:hypothetical protein